MLTTPHPFTAAAHRPMDQGDSFALEPSLLPVLAGARARGVCDACDALGLAVALMDEAGMVLHVNAAARGLMGSGLGVAGGHLVVADHRQTRALQHMIAAAVSGQGQGAISVDVAGGTLRLRAAPVANAERDPFQLLKALVVIEDCAAAS